MDSIQVLTGEVLKLLKKKKLKFLGQAQTRFFSCSNGTTRINTSTYRVYIMKGSTTLKLPALNLRETATAKALEQNTFH